MVLFMYDSVMYNLSVLIAILSDLGPTLGSLVQTWDPHLGPLFRPGTHTWVPCSDLGPTLGSLVQTCSNLEPTLGSLVQTWNPHLGPLFRPGTHTWVLFQTWDPQLDPLLRSGTNILRVTFCTI